MGAFEIVTGIILIIFALAIIAVVLLQEGSQSNVGVVSGAADTFLSKNQARQLDTFLARWTKFIAVGFFVLVILVNMIMFFTT